MKPVPTLETAHLTRWAGSQRIPTLLEGGRTEDLLGRWVRVRSERLYLSQHEVIERAIAAVCRRQGLSGADAEDFASVVRLRLVEDDYAVLRRFQGRSTLRTYLIAVITHCFQDFRNARWGKWRPSAEARRLGPLAVHLETLMVRDGLSFDEAYETLRTNLKVTETRESLEQWTLRFPPRSGRTFVSIEKLEIHPAVAPDADAPIGRQETAPAARETARTLTEALAQLPPPDQLILRMRFVDDCSVADISRILHLEQKPLYRHIDQLLTALRVRLEAAGISADVAAELLRHGGFDASISGDSPLSDSHGTVRSERSANSLGQTARPQ